MSFSIVITLVTSAFFSVAMSALISNRDNGVLNLYEGQECSHPSGSPGVCRHSIQCHTAQADIRKGMFPKICSFGSWSTIICCAKPERITTLPGGRMNRKPRSLRACERYSRNNSVFVTTFILGEEFAEEAEFPHMAALGYKRADMKKTGWFCGGTLISERYVLTAAHCINSRMGKLFKVRLGALNLTSMEEGAQEYNIQKTIPHPDYRGESYHDIALVQLTSRVEFKRTIMPACLYSESKISQQKLLISGWGATDRLAENMSDRLKKGTVRLLDQDECQESYANSRELTNGVNSNMVCVNDPTGKTDTCSGDSGGPVQFFSEQSSSLYSVVGVLSTGPFPCGAGGIPAVYTRVSSYLSWIEDEVWPQ